MTLFEKIFTLAKKTAQSLIRGEHPIDLEASDVFTNQAKERLLEKMSNRNINAKLSELNRIDAEKDWQLLTNRIKAKPRKRGKRYLVAASIIMLCILYVGYIEYGNYTAENQFPFIEVGSSKATLTLSNGNTITLGRGRTYRSINAQDNGTQLSYNNQPNKLNTTYNVLTVPRGGQYQLRLSDGTKVWLNSDSRLRYPIAFTEDVRMVELLYGEAFFEVSPSKQNNGKPFLVTNQYQSIEVLGTVFNVKAYPEETNICTTLVEGVVRIKTPTTTKLLAPGEQAKFNKQTSDLEIAKVDISYATSWVNGFFSFKDKPLKDIMSVLSRWYDVNIVLENETLQDVKFNGTLNRNQKLEDILNGIKNTKFINAYAIENRQVIIQ